MAEPITNFCYTECELCQGGKRKFRVTTEFDTDTQYWYCQDGDHIIVRRLSDQEIIGYEVPDTDSNWRTELDRRRNSDYNPQAQSWSYHGETRQRRVGGRGSHHYNFYPAGDVLPETLLPRRRIEVTISSSSEEEFMDLEKAKELVTIAKNGLNNLSSFVRQHRWGKILGSRDRKAVEKIQVDLEYLTHRVRELEILLGGENEHNDTSVG